MKPEQPSSPRPTDGRDPDHGNGNGVSARHEQLREFIAQHRVDSSARESERKARRGPRPTWVSLDELVAMGRTVADRVRPYVERVVGRLRARLHRK
jgi:hypothetical protein